MSNVFAIFLRLIVFNVVEDCSDLNMSSMVDLNRFFTTIVFWIKLNNRRLLAILKRKNLKFYLHYDNSL